MQPGSIQLSCQTVPDCNCQVFRSGNFIAELGHFFVEMAMIEVIDHFPVHQLLEPFQIDDEAGALVHRARYGDFERVIVPVSMRIVAFAEDALVLFRRKFGIVIEVRSGKLRLASEINHACALGSLRFIIRSVSGTPSFIRVPGLAFVALFIGVCGCDRGARPELVGRTAPDFTVTDSQRTVSLHDYKGQVVVLNFWASWCAPCIEELPSLLEMQKDLGDHVTVLAVATDEDPDGYKRFLRDHPMNVITVNDQQQKSSSAYGTTGWPETYIIDRNGIVRRKFIGPVEWTNPSIVAYLEKLRTES